MSQEPNESMAAEASASPVPPVTTEPAHDFAAEPEVPSAPPAEFAPSGHSEVAVAPQPQPNYQPPHPHLQQPHYQYPPQPHYQQQYPPQPQYQQQYPQQYPPAPQVKERNPILYAAIDFLITGLGLILQGRVVPGVSFLIISIFGLAISWIPFLGWIVFLLVLVPVWIISMVMAFNTAKQWNRQHGIIS